MKKSLLSIVLAVAVAMTAFGAMFIMPASALNGVDFLNAEYVGSVSDGATVEFVDGELVITATAAGQEVQLVPPVEANLNDYPFFEGALVSSVPFDICYYDANNGKWMFAAGDFCYNFNGDNGASNPIKAGTEDVKFSLTGAYTWTGAPLPANAAVKAITFIAKDAGTITISKCAMTDGVADVPLFPENEANPNWTVESLINDNADQWIPAAPENSGDSTAIVTFDNATGYMNFGNTNGNWPSASIAVDKTVNYQSAALNLDLSVLSGASTTVYVFFGDATPTDFDGAGKAYGAILADNTAGNYYGIVKLSDILAANSDVIDENGNVKISYIKVFATSGSVVMDPAVIVKALDVCYVEAVEGLGDVDMDDDVDTMDVLYALNIAVQKIQPTADQYARADYDLDGDVTFYDALCLFASVAGTTPDNVNTPNG